MVPASILAVTMWCYGIGITACVLPDELVSRQAVVACPYISEWPAAQQKQVAKELGTLGRGSASAAAIGNYIKLRDQARACRSKR